MPEDLPDTRLIACRHPGCLNRLDADGCNLKTVELDERGLCVHIRQDGNGAPGTKVTCTALEPLIRPGAGPIAGTCVHEEDCKAKNGGFYPDHCALPLNHAPLP